VGFNELVICEVSCVMLRRHRLAYPKLLYAQPNNCSTAVVGLFRVLVAEVSLPPPQAKCLPQIVWVRRFSHRIHRIHRNSCWGYSPTDCTDLHRLFGCVDAPTDFTEFTETLAGDILPQISRIYTDCLGAKSLPQISRNSLLMSGGALETSAPPEVSSFCVNPCNLWEKILSQKFCEFSVFCGRPSPARVSVQICAICGRLHPGRVKSVGELSQKLSDYEKKRNFALIARR